MKVAFYHVTYKRTVRIPGIFNGVICNQRIIHKRGIDTFCLETYVCIGMSLCQLKDNLYRFF